MKWSELGHVLRKSYGLKGKQNLVCTVQQPWEGWDGLKLRSDWRSLYADYRGKMDDLVNLCQAMLVTVSIRTSNCQHVQISWGRIRIGGSKVIALYFQNEYPVCVCGATWHCCLCYCWNCFNSNIFNFKCCYTYGGRGSGDYLTSHLQLNDFNFWLVIGWSCIYPRYDYSKCKWCGWSVVTLPNITENAFLYICRI